MKRKGYDDLLLIYTGSDSDQGSLADIMSATSEGLNVQIITDVCRRDNPDYTARNFRQNLGKGTVIRIWLYLTVGSS